MSMMASVPPTSWKCTCDGRPAVQPALDLGQAGEGGQGPLAGPLGQPGFGDQADDVGVGADHLGVPGPDADVGAGQAGSEHRMPRASSRRRAGRPAPVDLGEVGAGVDQAAERHVAGDAGEAVPPGEGRHRPVRSAGLARAAFGSAGRALDWPARRHGPPVRGRECGRRRRRRRTRCRCRPRPCRRRRTPAWPGGR